MREDVGIPLEGSVELQRIGQQLHRRADVDKDGLVSFQGIWVIKGFFYKCSVLKKNIHILEVKTGTHQLKKEHYFYLCMDTPLGDV